MGRREGGVMAEKSIAELRRILRISDDLLTIQKVIAELLKRGVMIVQ